LSQSEVSEMSNKVYKRNVTILRKIFLKHIPQPTSEQQNVFEYDIQNITVLSKKILSEKELEHIFLYSIYPALPKGE